MRQKVQGMTDSVSIGNYLGYKNNREAFFVTADDDGSDSVDGGKSFLL